MASRNPPLTGVERLLHEGDIIVSKSDLKGRITYANRAFMRIADYGERDLLGAPHAILRHPEMPRCIFKFMWERLQAKADIFAYVVNRTRTGDHYWVLAHVTPSFDGGGKLIGYHSNRRAPNRTVIGETIVPLYRSLCAIERQHANDKDGLQASYAAFRKTLEAKGTDYDRYIFSLS